MLLFFEVSFGKALPDHVREAHENSKKNESPAIFIVRLCFFRVRQRSHKAPCLDLRAVGNANL